MEFYDLMISDQRKSVIKNVWKASGITGVVKTGLANLPSMDPFADTDPLIAISNNKSLITEEEIVERGYARGWHNDSDEECEMEGQDETRSVFNIFDDIYDDGE